MQLIEAPNPTILALLLVKTAFFKAIINLFMIIKLQFLINIPSFYPASFLILFLNQ
jgi:hypothetical protein